jgi:hypothetical protein
MNISTRVMVSLIISLFVLGGALIGLAYSNMLDERDTLIAKLRL